MISGRRLAPLTFLVALTALVCAMALAAAARAQSSTPPSGGSRGAAGPRSDYHFDASDSIRIHLGKLKDEYYVGEPVVIPIVFINHMKYPVTLRMNVNPRSYLTIRIQSPGHAQRQYFGPYPPAFYAPVEPLLQPMQEFSTRIVIWGDADSDSGLAFPEPGAYTVTMALRIEVPEASAQSQQPFPPFEVKVVAPPANVAPLVDELKKYRAFIDLHGHALPRGHEERIMELVQLYPNTLITPYMAYACYESLLDRFNLHPQDKTLADRMLYYLQIATVPDTAFQLEGLVALLGVYDSLDLTTLATQTAHRLVAIAPRDLLGQIGNTNLVQKYVYNSAELDPAKYWQDME